jgi:hypothetical protein
MKPSQAFYIATYRKRLLSTVLNEKEQNREERFLTVITVRVQQNPEQTDTPYNPT